MYLIHRKDKLTAQIISQEKVFKNSKIEILFNKEVTKSGGKEGVEYVLIMNNLTGKENSLDVTGAFIFIGFVPNNVREHAEHVKLGFIITNEKMETSVRGVYAVGDIRVQPVRQVTNATADGTIAAVMAENYLEENNLIKSH